MKTIVILAEALAKASGLNISRLDIQYNTISEKYSAELWLEDNERVLNFMLFEDGTVTPSGR